MRTAIGSRATSPSFGLTLLLALALSLAVAGLLAPLVALGLADAGWRFPFPRICDRVVMVTMAIALILFARQLGLYQKLPNGFGEPARHLRDFAFGLAAALTVMTVLFALAAWSVTRGPSPRALLMRALGYGGAALLIALIEETFFRAILLAGLVPRLGRGGALIVSSTIYAEAHLIRSPHRYYLSGFDPMAGFDNLAASAARIVHPGDLLAMVFGLFLLGLVLGAVFILSGRVYASIGLHAGLVIGAKCWPLVARGSASLPRWLAGPGPVPLIAAPAAWAIALAFLLILFGWSRAPNRSAQSS